MKLRELESLLQDVMLFKEPKMCFEQYSTQPHLAATILYTIHSSFDPLDENTVIDLGTGTGMLSVGCALLDCPYITGVDIDPDCLQIAQENVLTFDDALPIDFICCDVTNLSQKMRSDIVVMNPPFGTKQKSIDRQFLIKAFSIAQKSVYSLHKTSTRSFIQSFTSNYTQSSELVAQLRYNLPHSYSFHKNESKDIDVDFWRFALKAE